MGAYLVSCFARKGRPNQNYITGLGDYVPKVTLPDKDQALPHPGIVGDTYTILLSGADTDGHYCLTDMLVPPGGGPPPHRHDFEESFTILEGEVEATP